MGDTLLQGKRHKALWDMLCLENNQLQGADSNSALHQAALHHNITHPNSL